MRILFDARPLTIPSPGGVTRLTRSLLQAVCESLPQETCIFGTTGWQELPLGITELPNTQRVHLRLPNKVVSSLTSLGLRSFEQCFPKTKPDVLLLPNNGHVGFPKIPYGLVVHDLSFIVEPRWFHWRGRVWHKIVHARRVMKEATHLFAVSEWTKFALMQHLAIPEKNIDVLAIPRQHIAAPPSDLPAALHNKRYLLCLGRRDLRKNASCVIEAVRRLHEDSAYQDLHLVIVGGHHEPLSDPRFVILPRVEDGHLSALYQHAQAFLYPSWYEGLGLPLHEAIAFGTPSISASTTALPDTAPAGTLFAPPGKPHLWANAIKQVLMRRDPTIPVSLRDSFPSGDWQAAVQPITQFLLSFKN